MCFGADTPKTCDSEVYLSDFTHARACAVVAEWLEAPVPESQDLGSII